MDTELDHTLKAMRDSLDVAEARVLTTRELATQLQAQQALFDSEDLDAVRARLEALQAQHSAMWDQYRRACQLYEEIVQGLRARITERRKVLNQLFDGGLMADPVVLQHFTNKQARLQLAIEEAGRRLSQKLAANLGGSE